MNQPIKRDLAIQPLSRDHHHGLLLCWKIRTGFEKGISAKRIKAYSNWFYEHHIKEHFEIEEKYVFPVLGNENDLVKNALEDHKLLKQLFNNSSDVENSLKKIQVELEKHIRFEERILFNKIQKAATSEQLKVIKENHSGDKFADNLSDQFWV